MSQRFLSYCAHLATARPWWVFAVACVLTMASLVFASTHLVTNADQDDLVSESLPYHKRYKDFLRDFGDQEYLYVVIETGNNLARAEQAASALAKRLGAIRSLRQVIATIDPALFERSALLHLSEDQLFAIRAGLARSATTVQSLAAIDGLDSFLGQIGHWMDQPMGVEDRETVEPVFQFFSALIDGMVATIAQRPLPASPWHAMGTLAGTLPLTPHGYIKAGGDRFLLLLIMPEKDFASLEIIAQPLQAIREAMAVTRRDFPDVHMGLTGRPVLSADEMAVTNRDMLQATILAFLLVTLLFVLYFRRLTRPFLSAVALAMGIIWTFGLTTLTIGSLNLLSTVFALILVGAGMEFGLHIVARYREERMHGASIDHAITTTILTTGRGNITAAITTALAFYMALLTDFLALRELGFIAGSGILLCLLSMLLVLPALLTLFDKSPAGATESLPQLPFTSRIGRIMPPRTILWGSVVLTLLAIPGMLRLHMDHNLLHLQAEGLESVEYEHRLIQETEESTAQAILITDHPSAIDTLATQLRQLPTVGRVESIRDILPKNIPQKIAIIQTITPDAIPLLPDARDAIRTPTFLAALTTIRQQLEEFADQALRAGETADVEPLTTLMDNIDHIRTAVRSGNPEVTWRLNQYHGSFMQEYQTHLRYFLGGLRPEATSLHDMPAMVRNRYTSASGRFAIYAAPTINIWDPQALATFVHEVRSVDPFVTGVPIEIFESTQLLQRSFVIISVLAFMAVLLIAWATFGNFTAACLAILPVTLGLCWLFGVMGYCNIPFTLANFFAIPILIGLGIDSGAQIMHRVSQDRTSAHALMQVSTGHAVILTSLTVLCSFGLLCMAQHRGIQGLGVVMAIGSTTIMLAALGTLPSLLRVTTPHATQRRDRAS